MVKTVLSVSHQGLRDWVVQRLSAIAMAVYTFIVLGFLIEHPNVGYPEWHHLFATGWMKVATMIFILSLLLHAWIGMWTIFTDYVKPFVLRMVLHTLVIFALLAFFFEGLLIIWSI